MPVNKKSKLKHLVKVWTQEEWDRLSKIRQLHVRIASVLYAESWKDLFTIEFWEIMNSQKYSCIGEWFFFLKYNLHWVVCIDKGDYEQCV